MPLASNQEGGVLTKSGLKRLWARITEYVSNSVIAAQFELMNGVVSDDKRTTINADGSISEKYTIHGHSITTNITFKQSGDTQVITKTLTKTKGTSSITYVKTSSITKNSDGVTIIDETYGTML